MFKKLLKNRYIYSVLLPFGENIDEIKKTNKTSKAFFNRNIENESGWDRLYLMFSIDEFNNISPEINSTIQAGFLGLFIGACYGGFIRSRIAYLDFMERNQATAFKSHLDAKKKLQDAVTINFAKGAYQWGWRLGLFSFMYVGTSTTIAVYRGKSGIIEYVIAGGLTGTLYKFQTGPRAMLVGGLLGLVLGTFAGTVSYGIAKLTGVSMEETRYWQYQWKKERNHQISQVYKKYAEEHEDPILKQHDQIINKTNIHEALQNITREEK